MAEKGEFSSDEDRKMWMSVLKLEAMSSDESGEDEDEEILIIHPIPWLTADVVSFKQALDSEIKKEKSPQANRQTKRRMLGSPSSRPIPDEDTLPAWAVDQ